MSTIKSDRVDYEKLLNGIDPTKTVDSVSEVSPPAAVVPSVVSSVIDTTTPCETAQSKMFEFDYDSVKKGLRKKARKSVLNIVKHIIPDDIIDEEYIQDKLEQDIDSLTELYMQLELNKVMQRSQVELVCSGNTMPRMYEVFGQMTEKIQTERGFRYSWCGRDRESVWYCYNLDEGFDSWRQKASHRSDNECKRNRV